MGEVYRARDEQLCRDVAVKVLAVDAAAEPGAVLRFTREAHAASALNHPNIISVFDTGESQSGPFLVMELVDGVTLRRLPHPPEPATIVRVGRQVAQALAVAHAAGIVHRDIKPDNVMVRGDGYVKVLDFGIARVAQRSSTDAAVTAEAAPTSTVEAVTGTIGYMSPEQARGEPVDAATDLFALGVVLYELATGRHPFAAPTALATAARLLSEDPPPPSSIAAGVTPALDALILRMLDKDPRRRPTAADVDRELEALTSAPPIRVDRVAVRTVGRDATRAALADAFEQAMSGRGLVVTVEGEPGIGKTTIVEEFLDAVAASRPACTIGIGRSAERHATGAYLPWLEALESMARHAGSSVMRLMEAAAPTWHAQVAPLTQGDSAEARALAVSRAGSQQWMMRELAQFLEQLARQAPVVLFFEDVHWADASTVDLIGYVAGRLHGTRLLVIATCRPSDLRLAQHPFLPLKLDLERRGVSRAIALDFLAPADVERYLALEFAGHRFPPALAASIYAKTEGNPLFMADLVRSLRERGAVERDGDGWRLTRPLDAVAREMPASIRSMIDLTLDRLDDEDRRTLVAASVQGPEFDSAVLARALGVEQADVEDRLDALGRLRAIVQPVLELELPDRTLAVRYRFVHVLYQNALYGSLGPSRRASTSAAVARALLAFHGPQAGAHAADVAALFETARDFSRAAEFFLIAAEAARRVFADREALALAGRGLDMIRALPDGPDRRARELVHLMALALPMHTVKSYAAPELDATYSRARAICDELGEHPQQFAVVTGIGAFRLMRAELREAQVSTEQMLRLARRIGDPVMSIWTDWAFGTTYGHLLERLPDALARLDEGARLYDPRMHAGFVVMTGFDAGIGCRFQAARLAWLLGDEAGALERATAALAAAEATEHPLMIAFAAFFEAWVHQHRHDAERTHRSAARALAVADQYGYPHISAWARAVDGWAIGCLGRPADGESLIRSAFEVMNAIGIRLLRPNFLALAAEMQMRQSRFDEAAATLREAREVVERTEERCYLPEILRLEAECLLTGAPRDGGARRDANAAIALALTLAQSREAHGFEPAIRAAAAALD